MIPEPPKPCSSKSESISISNLKEVVFIIFKISIEIELAGAMLTLFFTGFRLLGLVYVFF